MLSTTCLKTGICMAKRTHEYRPCAWSNCEPTDTCTLRRIRRRNKTTKRAWNPLPLVSPRAREGERGEEVRARPDLETPRGRIYACRLASLMAKPPWRPGPGKAQLGRVLTPGKAGARYRRRRDTRSTCLSRVVPAHLTRVPRHRTRDGERFQRAPIGYRATAARRPELDTPELSTIVVDACQLADTKLR